MDTLKLIFLVFYSEFTNYDLLLCALSPSLSPISSNIQHPIAKSVRICMPYHWDSVGHQVFQYLSETLLGFLIPFIFITVCYISVICRLRSAMFQKKGQGSRLVLLIIGAFALFWLPYHIINVLQVCYLFTSSSTVFCTGAIPH